MPEKWFADTTDEALDVYIGLHRKMSPRERLARVFKLGQFQHSLQVANVRSSYPQASAKEVFLRVASRRLGRDLMIQVYNRDPELIPDGTGPCFRKLARDSRSARYSLSRRGLGGQRQLRSSPSNQRHRHRRRLWDRGLGRVPQPRQFGGDSPFTRFILRALSSSTSFRRPRRDFPSRSCGESVMLFRSSPALRTSNLPLPARRTRFWLSWFGFKKAEEPLTANGTTYWGCYEFRRPVWSMTTCGTGHCNWVLKRCSTRHRVTFGLRSGVELLVRRIRSAPCDVCRAEVISWFTQLCGSPPYWNVTNR